MRTISAHGSIHLNRKMGGKFPHLTICAEAWILDYKVRVFFLDFLMILLFWELNHCRKQYLTYGTKPKGTPNDPTIWLVHIPRVRRVDL